jgi:drug/metabolite transporter (DMT)-like permease
VSTDRPTGRWTLGLLAVAFVWGSTFVVVQEAVDRLPVFPFNAWRFAIAAAVLGMIVRGELRAIDRRGVLRGVALGTALWAGYAFQTFGLTMTTAPKAAFITGMVVVITPLLQSVLLRRPPGAPATLGALLATVGLGLLTLEGSLLPAVGDLLVLGCAFSFALHLIGLGAWSRHHPVGALATVQLATGAVLHAAGGATQHVVGGDLAWMPPGWYVWAAIVFTAVFASSFAFFVQTSAQRLLSPARTAVILTMEPVFAWLTSWGIVPLLIRFGVEGLTPETFGPREAAGALLILVGMLWSELRAKEPADALAAWETGASVAPTASTEDAVSAPDPRRGPPSPGSSGH